MRYMLYDSNEESVPLVKEITYLEECITLNKLRYADDEVTVAFDRTGQIADVRVAPMLFIPFVENAFKHGVSSTVQSHIDIEVKQDDNLLHLTVNNSIINDNSISLDTNSGIGLVNTRRRLDLLYPGKYTLEIKELNANNEYTVHLTLDLS